MANFVIYKTVFEEAEQKGLFGEKALDKAQELFSGMFAGEKLTITKKKRNAEQVLLENEVEWKDGDIIVLFVCNDLSIKYFDKKEEKKQKSTPGCYVIIDNRPEAGLIAIEKASAFDNETDAVRNILQNSFNSRLSMDYGFKVNFRAKTSAEDFWKIVHDRVEREGDEVKRIEFEFPNMKKVDKKSIKAPKDTQKKLIYLSQLATSINAEKGLLNMVSEEGKALLVDQTCTDIAEMVHMCCVNGYSLGVQFSQYGMYRHGAEARALIPMAKEIIDEFVNGQTVHANGGKSTYRIVSWLDDVRKKTEKYKDEEKTKKGRKRRRQK